ncbi:MAG TPA: glycogen synthase GlgA [Polyangiaceae bacterium]|nr:glycogen synthase GlgA [Polyangiaceae bacterium]
MNAEPNEEPKQHRVVNRRGRPLSVLFVASEVAPFRKTGGLADVVGALPKALAQRGMDVRVVMPLYGGVRWDDLERLDGSLMVPMYTGPVRSGVRLGHLPGSNVRVYFVEHHRFFDRPYLYGPPGDAYGDNLERFSFFARAALELCKAMGFIPDILHAHDWQAALVPVYANTVEWGRPLHGCASVFTIHNLAYQGVFAPGGMFITGLGWEHLNPHEFEHFGDLNLMKAALKHSTMLSTVSPTYCREIQTSAFGYGLDGVLAERSGDLWGILNGIDLDEWNPEVDPHLPARYSHRDLRNKEECKAALQRELGLPVEPGVPLFGVVGRLTHQKGFDVLAHCMHDLMSWNMQMVLLGTGDAEAEHFFGEMSWHHGDRFRAVIGFRDALAHRIEAGSDFFIMPSRFEPCGLNQMYSLRYGSVPIVRRTGGLADTVENYDEQSGAGTGFCFDDLSVEALRNTIGWAVSTYHDRPDHLRGLQIRGMQQDFSWARAAEAYEHLYLEAYRRRRGHDFTAGE